jgi:hypothetical protein
MIISMVIKMKKTLLLGVFVFMCFPVFFSSPLWGLDLEIVGGLGNMVFDPEQDIYLTTGRVQVSGETGNNFAYSGGFERDFLLQNRLFANMEFKLDYITMELGPVVGLFNTSEQPINPGFSAGMGLEFPGIFFVNLKASSSLGGVLDSKGSYIQTAGEISAGFWVPYVVCSFNMNTKGFNLEKGSNHLTEDTATRYFFRADVFSKNVPYTCRLDLGYQTIKRSDSSDSISGGVLHRDTQTDEFKAFYIGLEASYMIIPGLKLLLGGEVPVYSWSVKSAKNVNKESLFFQAHTGVLWTLPSR